MEYDVVLKIQILISEGHIIVSATATHHCLCLVHSVHFILLECMELTLYFDIDVGKCCVQKPSYYGLGKKGHHTGIPPRSSNDLA